MIPHVPNKTAQNRKNSKYYCNCYCSRYQDCFWKRWNLTNEGNQGPCEASPQKGQNSLPRLLFFFFLRLSDTQFLKPEPTESAIASAFHYHSLFHKIIVKKSRNSSPKRSKLNTMTKLNLSMKIKALQGVHLLYALRIISAEIL